MPPAPAKKSIAMGRFGLGIQDSSQFSFYFFSVVGLALPDSDYAPSVATEFSCVSCVAFFVAFEFGVPEGDSRSRRGGPSAVLVPVPKASVHEYDYVMSWQHDVGLSGEILGVEPESVSHSVK